MINLAKYSYLPKFIASASFIYTLNWQNNLVIAQIAPDNSLGAESSQVNSPLEQNKKIDGGAIRGENLFHSFSEFNVGESETVNFTNPEGIANIFSRVTGNNISQILGDLGVSGNANLFLMNPNGIIFGEKASLNVNGSFIATTANSIKFIDGNQFITNPTNTQPLLTVSVPIELQFGERSGKIINQAQSLEKASFNKQFNSFSNPAGLQIKSNQTLALIGGEIILQGGNLTALGGKIELGSVDRNSLVKFALTESGINFDYSLVENFLDITATNREGLILFEKNFVQSPIPSILDASSKEKSGSIKLQGRNINLLNGSQLLTPTFGDISGGNLTINAAEQLTISGSNRYPFTDSPSSIFSSTVIKNGDSGNIIITTKRLIVRDSGIIDSSSTYGLDTNTGKPINIATGDAGNIDIVASEFINIIDNGAISSSSEGEGNAGDINLTTKNLLIDRNSKITVQSDRLGDAGNILIQAQSLKLDNNSKISAATIQSDGGNIELQIDNILELRNQSNISASVGDNGNGGNIDIFSQFLITSPQDNSDITATAESGRGGNITIEASGIFGISEQKKATQFSDIRVSSDFGEDGTFKLLSYDTRSNKTETESNLQLVKEVSNFKPYSCYANQQSQYIQTGRGGIPLDTTNSLIAEHTWEDWRVLETENSQKVAAENLSQIKSISNPINPIQGWMVNRKGEVVLTANPLIVTPHSPEAIPSGCN